MKILHVTPSYYPATFWGGPIFSVFGLCNALVERGNITLKVLTTDTAGPSLNQRLTVNAFPERVGAGYDVYYCRRRFGRDWSWQFLRMLSPLMDWADVVHLTAVYSFPTLPTLTLAKFKSKPIVWSPRGALLATRQWAGAPRLRAKHAFELLANKLVEGNRVLLHTTSEDEYLFSLKGIPRARAVIVPNGVELPPASVLERGWAPSGSFRILFVSRIDPKKGLEMLLEALRLLGDISVKLEVCGTGDESYVGSIRSMVETMGLASQVRFSGHLSGDEKMQAFMRSDLCVLPSHSENFGMVIAESLAHGVPVIASRGTPWQALEAVRCGRWIDNAPEILARAITELRCANLASMGARGRSWMEKDFSWPAVASSMTEVYESMMPGPTGADMLGKGRKSKGYFE